MGYHDLVLLLQMRQRRYFAFCFARNYWTGEKTIKQMFRFQVVYVIHWKSKKWRDL